MRRLYAVLGRDVSRSLSPVLHAAGAAAAGLDVAYVPVSCPTPAAFGRALDALRVLGAGGANVTIPYKIDAFEACTSRSALARKLGAVNTVAFGKGRTLRGTNTDGPGIVAALGELPRERFRKVQLLGAGGSARAAAWACAELGAREIHVCARRAEEAASVAAVVRGVAAPLAPVAGATLVVSTIPGTPALAREALSRWIDRRARPALLDLAYKGLGQRSPLAAGALRRGWIASDGLRVLAEQAALALAWWTGGDLSLIRGAMMSALTPAPGRA